MIDGQVIGLGKINGPAIERCTIHGQAIWRVTIKEQLFGHGRIEGSIAQTDL